jgi:hypothetical protein
MKMTMDRETLKGYRDAWKVVRKLVEGIMEKMVDELAKVHDDPVLSFVHVPVAELERVTYQQRFDVKVVGGTALAPALITVLNFHFYKDKLYVKTGYLEETMIQIRRARNVSAVYTAKAGFTPEGDPLRIARRIIKEVIPESVEDRNKTDQRLSEYALNVLAETKLKEELESMGLKRSPNNSSPTEGSYDLPGQVTNYKFTTGTVKTYNGRIQHLELRSMPDQHADRIALIYFMAHGKSIDQF